MKPGAPLPARVPVATYRLQLNAGFTLHDAAALVPYLATIGITECYCSPILASRPGSTHGYDVIDHSRIDPEIGGDAGLRALADACRAHDLGVVVDFVPNHMSTDPVGNAWWRSVLENGPSSTFAKYFDIDWDPVYAELKQKVLLPILGEQYGASLENGVLQLELADRVVQLRYHNLTLPINPRRLRMLLAHDLDRLAAELSSNARQFTEFQSVLYHLEHLPIYTETDPRRMADRQREKDIALSRLSALLESQPAIRRHVERNIETFNGSPGQPKSFDRLHALLEAQPYRLSSWRTAVHEINYRRFFDLNDLAGLRPEEPEVFAAMHALVGRLVRDGLVTGLRLDHVDGLFDPAEYLRNLHACCGDARPWVVVEKILSADETLSGDWLAHGTTGYDFLNDVTGVFVDQTNAGQLRRVYTRFTGEAHDFREIVCDAKRLITTTSMAGELNLLAYELNRISEGDRHWRDFTLDSLQEALQEIVACFPAYRTYVSPAGWSPPDEATVDRAIAEALRRNPALEPTIFGFIRQMLLPVRTPGLADEEYVRRLRFAMRFQQYTSPVQAKGVEDTAFYRYAPLLSLNEVGAEPAVFGVSLAAFHARNERRLRDWPLAMLATTTHDTKRGEDARTRLDVLSEIPEQWGAALTRWHALNENARPHGSGDAPDLSDELFYYQTLLGAWPTAPRWRPDAAFLDRVQQTLRKAMREAKRHTSWINPSERYEAEVLQFVNATLTSPASAPFRRSLATFVHRVAYLGMVNSLSQLVLKIAAPGVPDFYQGSELWDLSLVDPDNRRDVDFAQRRRFIESLGPLLNEPEGTDRSEPLKRLVERWFDGRVKLFVTAVGLRLRRRLSDLFLFGEYLPVPAAGVHRSRVIAFVRQRGTQRVLVVAPRLVAPLVGAGARPPLGSVWADTTLTSAAVNGSWRNAFTGDVVKCADGTAVVAATLSDFPVGLFESEATA